MYRKRATLFAVGILLLCLLLFNLDLKEFLGVISRVNSRMMTLLVIVQAIILFMVALKWYVIVRRYAVSFTNVMHTSLIGLMVNSITPASIIGGEPVKAYVLSRIDRIKPETAFATVFVDLFVTVLPVLILDLLAIVLVLKYSFDLRIVWALTLMGVFILALAATSISVLLHRRPSMRLLNRLLDVFGRVKILRRHVEKLKANIDDLFVSFHRSIRDTMTDTWTLSVAIMVSSLVWLLSIMRVYLIFRAVGVPIDAGTLIIVYTVMIAVSILPLLPGAIGMWEWVGTGLFTFFGVPVAQAAAVVFIDRLLFFWLPIILGFASSLHIGINVVGIVEESD